MFSCSSHKESCKSGRLFADTPTRGTRPSSSLWAQGEGQAAASRTEPTLTTHSLNEEPSAESE